MILKAESAVSASSYVLDESMSGTAINVDNISLDSVYTLCLPQSALQRAHPHCLISRAKEQGGSKNWI